MFKRLDEPDPATSAEEQAAAAKRPAIVDVTMQMQEGKQYFVNRITFVGNNTTRDHVIRREMNLVENGIFNTEALKHSVKRLNQLGYFKQLEGNEAIKVEKTPQEKNKVDVTLKLEEQNRNQLQFGAGVFAVRRHVPAVRVQHVELHRPRRNAVDVGADGRALQGLSGVLHRAVPVRPADHRRRQRVQPEHRAIRSSSRSRRRAATSCSACR